MRIVATYTGRNGDQGYITGSTYRLIAEANNIRRPDGHGFVPYKSLAAFLRNWNNIRVMPSGS